MIYFSSHFKFSDDQKSYVCLLEKFENIETAGSYEVLVSSLDLSDMTVMTASTSIRIDPDLTPIITSISPTRGGSAGGTRITFTGSNLDTGSGATVVIHGIECIIKSIESTEIICETEPYSGVKEPVQPVVTITGNSLAKFSDPTTTFWYIDRWSSPFTWGCNDDSCKPQAGDIVVIPKGQVILLDESTPILAVLIVDGGTVLWDRKHGIHFKAEYAVVTNDGYFQIGTEDDLFCDPSGDRSIPFEARITMYGHQRSVQLPIYGAKVFSVRKGRIDMHGCRVHTSWTTITQTADAGTNQLVLNQPVKDDWVVGDQIVVATTGDLTRVHQSEVHEIASVSEDGKTLTLVEPLKWNHIGECTSGWDWAGTLCQRAEIGLLSKNVKFKVNLNFK